MVVAVILTNLLVLAVCGGIVGVYALIVRDAHLIAAFSRRVAVSVALGFTVLATLFVSGYVFEDPGGLEAWVITAAWVVPMIGLGIWAWVSPRTVEPVLWALLACVVVLSAWWAYAPSAWQDFMDTRGPVIGVLALAVGACLAVWGYRRPVRGAVALIVVAVVPVVGAGLAAGFGFATAATSTAVTVSPFLTCALLYLLAWRLDRRPARSQVPLPG